MGKVFKALKRAESSTDEAAFEEFETEAYVPPAVDKEIPLAATISPRKAGSTSVDAETGELVRPGQWDERLILSTVTTGPVAESIRTLRTRILYPPMGRVPRSLLVTSASPGEGKSFICSNLGISLAQGVDNYCLLVDCDLRRPMQHTLFGLDNKRGLSEYLQYKRNIAELLSPSGIDKLSLLQAGPRSINPAELLGSSSMISLVDEMVKRYDDRIVLFDSPPLHAASETSILAQYVDGVILVVRYGGSRREYIKGLVDAIGRDKIIGIVFNAYKSNLLDTKVFGYYEYHQNYYYTED